MNGQLQHELAKSYRMDLVDAIEKAQEGYLPPSVQEYCFEEIEKTWGTEEYPPDGDSLFAQLREVLGTHTQISDREQAEMELQALGVELLFYVNVDRFTFAEITHLRREDTHHRQEQHPLHRKSYRISPSEYVSTRPEYSPTESYRLPQCRFASCRALGSSEGLRGSLQYLADALLSPA